MPFAVAIVVEIPFAATLPTEMVVKAAGWMVILAIWIPERLVLTAVTQIMDKDLQTVIRPVEDFLHIRLAVHNCIHKKHQNCR